MTDENQPSLWINPRLIRPQNWSPNTDIDPSNRQWDVDEMNLAANLAALEGMVFFAKDCYQFYTNTKPLKGLSTLWTPWSNKGINTKHLQDLIPQISDVTVRELCQFLANQVQALDDTNKQWGSSLASFINSPIPQTEEDFEKLRQKLDNYRKKKGPVWATQAEFQPLITQLQQVVSETEQLWLQLQARLQHLYSHILVNRIDIGDQRAKDLIDQSDGEANPKRAINLLKRALRYTPVGIQASKAYLGLGNRYTDLGNIAKAIENYTKSIEVWREPNPMALYWRGELYYQQNQREEARNDFEQALSSGLFSPEREQAQKYLSELRSQ